MTQFYRREIVFASYVRKLSLLLPIILFSFGLIGQNPVVTVRFANPQYDCSTGDYCLDVEFNSDTPDQELFGMNVRFFYDDDVLELIGFGDFQGGYGSFAPNPPEISTSVSAGPALFDFPGSAEFVNGAIQLVNTGATSIEIPTGVDDWVKIFQVCFTVDDSSIDLDGFCPVVVWDLEQTASSGGFLTGDDGVVITVVNPDPNEDSAPADEQVVHNNWQYTDPVNPPYGEPVEESCVIARCIDLALNKSVTTSTPAVGSSVVFTIEVENSGSDPATNVVVSDLLSDGFSYDSDNSGGDYNDETGVWTIASIAGGSSAELEITAIVNSSGDYTNLAEVFSATGIDEDSTPGNGVDTDGDTNVEDDDGDEDDGDGVVVFPINASLVVTKTDVLDLGIDGILNENDVINYTFIVSNTGNVTIDNLVLSDPKADAGSISCPYSILASGASMTCTASHTITEAEILAGSVVNIATANGQDPADNPVSDLSDDPDNPADIDVESDDEPDDPTITLLPVASNPAIEIVNTALDGSDLQTVNSGETASFEITVTNTGDVDLENVLVTAPNAVGCENTIGSLTVGSSVTYTCSVSNVTAEFTNIASVTGDPVGGGSSVSGSDATEVDLQGVVDLALSKYLGAGEDELVELFEDVTFIIEVINEGDITVQDLEVIDYIPPGFKLSPIDDNGWTATGDNYMNAIPGPIVSGASETVEIILRITSEAYILGLTTVSNIAEIQGAFTSQGIFIDDIDSTPDGNADNDRPGEDDTALQ
ncbi:MAG: DUF11 domain-containing protein, partial [Bacteroidetes bacterium]|nr:DUF11 domain-containing protein [Bacteroidota bacterium]